MTVPLVTRGRVLGVITWVAAESGRHYDQVDVSFAEDLAERAAVAIDNSELHSETLQAAVRLQHAVLPEALPEVPRCDLAAFYSPSGRTEVGGDFYDVIPLEDGRVVLFVGDVMGRGVAAAASMAQMRAAVRAYIALDPAPDVVLNRLDRMLEQYGADQLVTLIYLVVDLSRDEVLVSDAGHPAPLVLRRDGRAERMPVESQPPLGVARTARRCETVSLHAGESMLVFTDGLVERRGEDLDRGGTRLLEALGTLGGADLGAGLADLVGLVRDPTRDDDVAALALRRHG
jgi:serine phosphatase RsbU (regulator of sigma subunit)